MKAQPRQIQSVREPSDTRRSSGEFEELKKLVSTIAQHAENLNKSIECLASLTSTKQYRDHDVKVPAITQQSIQPFLSDIKKTIDNLDSINTLHLLLAGTISNAVDKGHLDTPHPNTAVSELLHLPSSEAHRLHSIWIGAYKKPEKPTLTACILADVYNTLSSEDDPTGIIVNENTHLDDVPLFHELSEHEQRRISKIQEIEYARRLNQQKENIERAQEAFSNKRMSSGVYNTIVSGAMSVKDYSPVSKEDVISEAVRWIDAQYEEYESDCKGRGVEPNLNVQIVTEDMARKYVNVRTNEINSQFNPTDRIRARQKRYFSIGAQQKDSLVPTRGLITPDAAANLYSVLAPQSAHRVNHPDGKVEDDTRTLGQRQADGLDQMVSDAAEHARSKKQGDKGPRVMLSVATETTELQIMTAAATLAAEGKRQITKLYEEAAESTSGAAEQTVGSGEQTQTGDAHESVCQGNLPSPFTAETSLVQQDCFHTASPRGSSGNVANTSTTERNHYPPENTFSRTNLNIAAHPPGTIHPTVANAVNKALHKASEGKFDVTSPEDQRILQLATSLLLTHTFETNAGISLTLDELARLGISDTFYLCEIDPEKANVISLQSQYRSGGPLFRAIKTIEQGVCAMAGETMGTALCDLHHITPWARSINSDFENLVAVSRSRHCANDDTHRNPHKGHFATDERTGITGWVHAKHKKGTGHVFVNNQPEALRAPARLIRARKQDNTASGDSFKYTLKGSTRLQPSDETQESASKEL